MRALKAELPLTSGTDFLSEAMALLRWVVSERKLGQRIISDSVIGERRVLVLPRLERVAPNLPRSQIQ